MNRLVYKRAMSMIIACILFAVATLQVNHAAIADTEGPGSSQQSVHLPMVFKRSPLSSPFGIESHNFANDTIKNQAANLKAQWIRLNGVSWRKVQPNPGDPFNWSAIAYFEQELIASAQLKMTPIVVVDDAPRWATVVPSSCAAIRTDRFGDFAAFMKALVTRYSQAPYNVRHWEIGNEVDVDPSLVPVDSVFGCWGDKNDPFYGGRHYANMLKVVTPAIKEADPRAKVLSGGLMVSNPDTQSSDSGNPAKFLDGILEAGGAPYFDILAYHGHGEYYNSPFQDNRPPNPWTPYGSGLDSKANYIKSVLKRYGVTKPLFLDEASYTCPDYEPFTIPCQNPPLGFFDEQANFVIRGYVTALSAGVEVVIWYTIEGPGWRNAALLDGNQNPRPVFLAYKTLIEQLAGASLPPLAVSYGDGVRGWRFDMGGRYVDVVYASFIGTKNIAWPAGSHIAMYNRFGQPLTPGFSGGNATYGVTTQPIFIHRKP